MRQSIFALVFIILGFGHIHGQKLISPDIEQGRELYTSDHYFTSPSAITIYSSHELILGDWTVEFLAKDDTYKSISCWDALTGKCLIDPQHDTSNSTDWDKAKRIFVESYNRDFFQFRVTFTTPSGKAENIEFMWALLPSRPEISNVEFTYIYNWETDDIYPNGNFYFDVYSDCATTFNLYYSESFLFEPTDLLLTIINFETNGYSRIGYDADWGEYVHVFSGNRFGYVPGELMCTTSYITDEDILNRIEELRRQAGYGLPPAVNLSYTYLDSDNEDATDIGVRLYFSDTKGVNYLVLEGLREGARMPGKIVITDLKKGYFDTTIDCNTTFTAVSYNDNGYTRGESLFVPYTADITELEVSSAEVTRVIIYNLNGTVIFDGTPTTLTLQDLPSGIYIKKEVLSTGANRTDKIIIR